MADAIPATATPPAASKEKKAPRVEAGVGGLDAAL